MTRSLSMFNSNYECARADAPNCRMNSIRNPKSAIALAISSTLLSASCVVTTELPTEAPVRDFVVRDTAAKYYVYEPSHYTPQRAWPLVIICHGPKPFDSAWTQMREWAKFAEKHEV